MLNFPPESSESSRRAGGRARARSLSRGTDAESRSRAHGQCPLTWPSVARLCTCGVWGGWPAARPGVWGGVQCPAQHRDRRHQRHRGGFRPSASVWGGWPAAGPGVWRGVQCPRQLRMGGIGVTDVGLVRQLQQGKPTTTRPAPRRRTWRGPRWWPVLARPHATPRPRRLARRLAPDPKHRAVTTGVERSPSSMLAVYMCQLSVVLQVVCNLPPLTV